MQLRVQLFVGMNIKNIRFIVGFIVGKNSSVYGYDLEIGR